MTSPQRPPQDEPAELTTSVAVSLFFREADLNADRMRSQLGIHSEQLVGLEGGTQPAVFDVSSVVAKASPSGDQEFVTVVTIRSAMRDSQEPDAQVSIDDFFRIVVPASASAEIVAFASADLAYSSASARWRVPILAEPPGLGDHQSALGRISLAGLRLRFEESPVGLYEANIGRSPARDELSVSLQFSLVTDSGGLRSILDKALTLAKEWAALFVVPVASTATATGAP